MTTGRNIVIGIESLTKFNFGQTLPELELYVGEISYVDLVVPPSFGNCNAVYEHTLGNKHYELTNHLGNVLVTVTDKKIPEVLTNVEVLNDEFEVDGDQLGWEFNEDLFGNPPSSNFDVDVSNNKLTLTGDILDNLNKTVYFEEGKDYNIELDIPMIQGVLLFAIQDEDLNLLVSGQFISTTGTHDYNFTGTGISANIYLVAYDNTQTSIIEFDNVKVTSDEEMIYHADVSSANDYYAFGMLMPGRKYQSPDYRYCFQGQEKDDEVKGEGNSVNYKYRMHDPRIGRFFAVDPLAPKFPHNSPYAFSENKVIAWVELEGLESYFAADGSKIGNVGMNTQVRVINSEDAEEAAVYIKNINNSLAEMSLYMQKSHDPNERMTEADHTAWRNAMSLFSENTSALNGITESSLDMTEEELYLRTFLTIIRVAENGNKPDAEPLGYNVQFGGGTFSDYSEHPDEKVTKWGRTSSAAGAYQFLSGRWDRISADEGLDDFSPNSQDQGALYLIREQERWNPRASGVIQNINSGNLLKAASQLNGTWTSLPGGSQQHMGSGDVQKIGKQIISNEISGDSQISTEQGQLKL